MESKDRRREWEARKLADGICPYCGVEPLTTNKRIGFACLRADRLRKRKAKRAVASEQHP